MRRSDIVRRVTDAAVRTGEPIAKQPLLELCGEKRVLIENHMGIGEYSAEAVRVKVKYGSICVSGNQLELCCMTSQQLVITGEICAVTLQKGRGR